LVSQILTDRTPITDALAIWYGRNRILLCPLRKVRPTQYLFILYRYLYYTYIGSSQTPVPQLGFYSPRTADILTLK